MPTPTPSITNIVVPDKYKNDKFIQLLLSDNANLKKEITQVTKERDDKDSQLKEVSLSRNTWQSLFMDERKSSDDLRVSYSKLQDSYASQTISLSSAQNQRLMDKNLLDNQAKDIKHLKRSRVVYAGITFIFGLGTGYAVKEFGK